MGVYGEPHVDDLIATADIVIDAGVGGRIDHDELFCRSPDLVIAVLSPFGLTGPYRDKPATEFTLQAESGTMGLRARPDQPPLQAGGRVFEWVLGSYAAVGAMAAFLRARDGRRRRDHRLFVDGSLPSQRQRIHRLVLRTRRQSTGFGSAAND